MRDILDIVFKRKTAIVLIMLCSIIAVLITNYMITPVYRSEARVLVQLGREATLPPTALNTPLLVGFDREEQINSHLQILKSRNLLEQSLKQFNLADFQAPPSGPKSPIQMIRYVLKKSLSLGIGVARSLLTTVGLLNPLTEEQRTLLSLEKTVKAERVSGTQVIKITFESPNPVMAQKFLTVFLKAYLQAAAMTVSGPPNSMNMFMEQAANLSDRLRIAETNLADYRRKWEIFGLDTQKQKIIDELTQTASSLRQTELELNAVTRLLEDQKNQPKEHVETSLPEELRKDEAVIELLKNLVRLKVRYSQATATLSASNPDTKALAKELASLRARIAAEVKGILLNRQVTLTNRKQDLLNQQQMLMQTAQELDQRGIEMARLERQVDLSRQAFMKYSEKEELSRLDQVMGAKDITELAVIQPPTFPIEPSRPRRLLNLLLSAVVGLLLGLIFAFSREYLTGTINRGDELAKLIGSKTVIDLPESQAMSMDNHPFQAFEVGPPKHLEGLDPDNGRGPTPQRRSS